RGYRRRLHETLPAVEARTGVTVGIENMFPVHVGSRPLMLHANQDLDELEGIQHLVLDTSHAAVAKHDLIDVRRRFGDRLRQLHQRAPTQPYPGPASGTELPSVPTSG